MGRAKEEMMRQEALGYSWGGQDYICADCIGDYAIKDFIVEHVAHHECNYCENESKELIAASAIDVVTFIAEGICREWAPIEDISGRNDGEWDLPPTDSDDLLFSIALECQDDFFSDLIDAFSQNQWCDRYSYSSRKEDNLYYGWQNFCEQVKHQSRYVFFRIDDVPDKFDHGTIPASKMLDVLAGVIQEQGLISVIPSGRSIYRTRIHDPAENASSASELGSPPVDKCTYSNRMSPAGIPMFYGASDPKTAILETYEETADAKAATCGEFKTNRELRVLDLTDLPDVPSLFDEDKRHLRPAIKFLQGFVDDVSKPIHKDERSHIEYVPTQALAEFFRHIYRDEEGNALDGIMYSSSKNPDGINYVLFAENEHCCDKGGESPSGFMVVEPWLVLESVEGFDPVKVLKEHEDDLRSKSKGLLGFLE